MTHTDDHTTPASAFDRTEPDTLAKDMEYSPASETDTAAKQSDGERSAAFDDPEIDESAVKTLPGTGGPDDVGDIEVDASDINLP